MTLTNKHPARFASGGFFFGGFYGQITILSRFDRVGKLTIVVFLSIDLIYKERLEGPSGPALSQTRSHKWQHVDPPRLLALKKG